MKRIDMEAHFLTEEHTQFLLTRKEPPRDEHSGETIIRWLSPELPTTLGTVIEDLLHELGDGRIEKMNAAGIDIQILSLSPPSCEQFEASEGTDLAKKVNDYLAKAIKSHPNRFIGLATIAPQDPKGAADELERAVTKLGFKGTNLNSHIKGEYLDNKKFWCIFEKAEKLDVPIYIHPNIPSPSMLKPYAEYGMALCGPTLGFGDEVALHAMRLIFSGVFDHYPGLKIILGHLGEALPFWLDRIDYFWQKPRMDPKFKPQNAQKPSYYIKNNFMVTTSGMPFVPAFICAFLALGVDNIGFASDYPYENSEQAVKSLEATPICDADKEKIFHLNAERLFKLKT